MSRLQTIEFKLNARIVAPRDLVWEFVIESSYEPNACLISGMVGGELLEEFADGVMREIVFLGKPMKQRVYVNDELFLLTTESFSSEDTLRTSTLLRGEHNLEDEQVTPMFATRFLTTIEIEVEWDSPDLRVEDAAKLREECEARLESVKELIEQTWAEAKSSEKNPLSHMKDAGTKQTRA